jgi:hypothetical protein
MIIFVFIYTTVSIKCSRADIDPKKYQLQWSMVVIWPPSLDSIAERAVGLLLRRSDAASVQS